MFVKDVCSNAQTISKTRKYFSCVIMQPLHPQKFSFSSEKTFISSVHYPELGKPHNCKTNGGKTEDLIYSEQITYKITFDKLSEIKCCHCLWQSTSPTILNLPRYMYIPESWNCRWLAPKDLGMEDQQTPMWKLHQSMEDKLTYNSTTQN